MTKSKLNDEVFRDIFSHHVLSDNQLVKSVAIRNAAVEFTKILIANTMASADQNRAIGKIREIVWTANSLIALGGK